MVKINGSSMALQYKRTTSRPIDSTEVFDTIEDARVYARNTDAETYVPYAGQIISVVENGGTYQLVKDPVISEADGKKHYKLVQVSNKNDTDDDYLSKVNEDTARELIHFLKGIDAHGISSLEDIKLIGDLLSSNYHKGSNGFGIWKDELGKYHLDISFIDVRDKMNIETLVVNQSYHVKGAQYQTKASLIISRIEGNRCYFTNKTSDGVAIYNQFQVGDLAFNKTFNLLENHTYWKNVTAVGEDYIELSGGIGDSPQVGDSVVHLGNVSDKERQGAIISDDNSIKIYKGITTFSLPTPFVDLNPDETVIKARLISEATGKDVDDSLEEITQEVSKIKEQTDKSFTIWFEDYMPTLENEPASLWMTDDERYEHEQDIFYNTAVKAGEGGRAFRYEKNEDGTYSWNEITDKDTLAALEQVAAAQKAADKAQETADSKKRVFVATPDVNSVYDIGDMWVNAVYDDETTIYKNDSLVCITAKAKGSEFSIAHWKPTSKVTTALFENLGDQIIGYVNDSNKGIEEAKKLAGKGINDALEAARKAAEALGMAIELDNALSENSTVIQQTINSITALAKKISFDADGDITNISTSGLVTTDGFNALLSKKITFDKEGHVSNISTSGLVTTDGFAQIFSERAEADGYVKSADMSTFITEDDAGKLISNATISADKIDFKGGEVKINADNIDFKSGTVKINSDKIDFESGTVKISADRIDLDGDVLAQIIQATGLNVGDKFIVTVDENGQSHVTAKGRIEADSGVFSGSLSTPFVEVLDESKIIFLTDNYNLMLTPNSANIEAIAPGTGIENNGKLLQMYNKSGRSVFLSNNSFGLPSTTRMLFEDGHFMQAVAFPDENFTRVTWKTINGLSGL